MTEAAGKVCSGFGHSPHRLISDRVTRRNWDTTAGFRLTVRTLQVPFRAFRNPRLTTGMVVLLLAKR